MTDETKCPECNNSETAEIVWGYVHWNDEIKKLTDSKQIVLGGCIITDHDPKWHCNTCHHRWGQRDD